MSFAKTLADSIGLRVNEGLAKAGIATRPGPCIASLPVAAVPAQEKAEILRDFGLDSPKSALRTIDILDLVSIKREDKVNEEVSNIKPGRRNGMR